MNAYSVAASMSVAVSSLLHGSVQLHGKGRHVVSRKGSGSFGGCREPKLGHAPAITSSVPRFALLVEGPRSLTRHAPGVTCGAHLSEPPFSSVDEHRCPNGIIPPNGPVPARSSPRGHPRAAKRHLTIATAVEEEAHAVTADFGPDGSSLYSVSDGEYAQQGLVFSTLREDVDLLQLNELFARVGFPRRDVARLTLALKNTFLVMSVVDLHQRSGNGKGRLVGFARATSDGVFHATIWDVAVDPAYQKRGIGKALMERMLLKLRSHEIPSITLFSEPQVVAFYKMLGFITDPSGIRAMALSKNTFKLPL